MVNELVEPSCFHWVETAGFTNPSQQCCTRSWGFHTVRGGVVRGDRFRPRLIGAVDIRKESGSEDGTHIPRVPVASRTPVNQRSASGVGVPTPRGAVSTRRITVFVPGLLELYMYARTSDPGMGPYPSQVALALRTPGWGFHTVRGVVDPRDQRFRPRVVGVVMYGNIYDPRMISYPPRVALALRTPGWGFHTVGGGIDPGDHRFRPSVVDLWKDF